VLKRTKVRVDIFKNPTSKCASIGAREEPLISYQIRIMRADGSSERIRLFHFSNDAAIQVAREFAGGNRFEVWQSFDCIFALPPEATFSPQLRSEALNDKALRVGVVL